MRSIEPSRILEAVHSIDPVFLDTPLVSGTSLDDHLGVSLAVKVECLNPIRSFKGRGTGAFVAGLRDASHLVCASAGNFGQGLAWAGARRGLPVTVFAAEQASPFKIAAMRRFKADVKLIGADFDEAKIAARAFAQSNGATFVEDGADPAIAEGAGTIAREVTEAGEQPDIFLVPLGNGALATGIGAWFKHASPQTRIVGVVAAGAPSMLDSFKAQRPLATQSVATIADGIAVREPVPYAVACMRSRIDDVIAVEEDAIIKAMRLIHEHLGLVVEPSGAVGIAALLNGEAPWKNKRVVTVLCGSNLSSDQIGMLLG